MRSLWRLIAALALVAALAPALAGAQNTSTNIDCAIGYHMSGNPPQCVRNTLTVASAAQPQGGQALAGATVAMVAVALTNPGSTDTTITGITVQRVGSAPDAAVAKLQVNDSATSVLANVPAQFSSTHSATIPLSATVAAGASKTLLVSVTMASNLTAYRGQSFEINITGITTAAALSGPLPVYGAQATISTNIPPPTCSLGASRGTFQVGDTVNVEWSSTNATQGTITGIGSVAPSGLQGILPGGQSQTLVGTFTGPGGTGTCQLTLTLNAQGTGGTIFGGGVGGDGGVGTPGTVAPPGQNGSGGAVVGSGGTASTPTGGTVGSPQGQGLIPCTGLDCRPCDFAGLAQNVINTLIGLSIPLAAAMFAWAGILYFTSASNPKNIEKARSVFKVVFWGFLIAISAWLIIQILINAVVSKNFFTNGSWNSLSCSSANSRPGTPGAGYSNIGTVISQGTGGINNAAPNEVPLAVGQTSVFNSTFSNFSGPTCGSGYTLTNDVDGNSTCWNSSTNTFQNPTYASTGGANADIAAAATAYLGTNTTSGPDNGNLACAWAVNNILQGDGIAPIDGNSVALMETDLRNGRGTFVTDTSVSNDLSGTSQGDIVVWKDYTYSHVGICLDNGCSRVASNSSSGTFSNVTNVNFNSNWQARIYHVNR